jgi:hypothetical protein
MPETAGLFLLNQHNGFPELGLKIAKRWPCVGGRNEGHMLNACSKQLFNMNRHCSLGLSVTCRDVLNWQVTVSDATHGNYRSIDFHGNLISSSTNPESRWRKRLGQ